MAIGTTAAIVGASVIGAGSAALSSRSQSRAADRASQAQVQAADQSARVQREIYYDQAERQEPFRQLGLQAVPRLSALMGYNDNQQEAPNQPQTAGPNLVDLGGGRYGSGVGGVPLATNNPTATVHDFASYMRGASYPKPTANNTNTPNLASLGAGVPSQGQTSQSALEALQQTPGFQFRLRQGQRQHDASAAARGMTMSGAQARALARYNQDYASNEYTNEINRNLAILGGGQVATQNVNGAAGQYGVGAANAYTNAGNARASGYINRGNASANGIGGVANAAAGGLGAWGAYHGWGK